MKCPKCSGETEDWKCAICGAESDSHDPEHKHEGSDRYCTMKCKECGKENKPLFSHGRCKPCADKVYFAKKRELAKNKPKQQPLPKQRKPINHFSERSAGVIKADNEFYALVWAVKVHYCEECGEYLGDKINKVHFSHILSKGSFPNLRHDIENCRLLCFNHHQQWEFGNRTTMKIYHEDSRKIYRLKRKSTELSKQP